MEFNFNINVNVHHHNDGEILELLRTIKTQGEAIMSAISDFADKMKIHTDKVDAAVEGITSDLAELKDQIAKLQASQGQITTEDQALLDGIEAKAAAIAEKVDALDALTPPVVPTP